MTGGAVVILGPIGKNFAAGMSGGEAYLFDEQGLAERYVNLDGRRIEPVTGTRDRQLLRRMLENHVSHTGSTKATQLLDDWDEGVPRFVKVVPEAYAAAIARQLANGRDIRVKPPRPAVRRAA